MSDEPTIQDVLDAQTEIIRQLADLRTRLHETEQRLSTKIDSTRRELGGEIADVHNLISERLNRAGVAAE